MSLFHLKYCYKAQCPYHEWTVVANIGGRKLRLRGKYRNIVKFRASVVYGVTKMRYGFPATGPLLAFVCDGFFLKNPCEEMYFYMKE